MDQVKLEHVNITVGDLDRAAEWLGQVFGWSVRWRGPAISGGESVHVGTDAAYVALYCPPEQAEQAVSSYGIRGGLNHVGVVVADLDATEERVKSLGFQTFNHADYEPGRRFYFEDAEGIEWEVVSYAS